jgi:hypothetical protein
MSDLRHTRFGMIRPRNLECRYAPPGENRRLEQAGGSLDVDLNFKCTEKTSTVPATPAA